MIDILHNQYGFVYGIQSLELIKVGVAMDIDKRLNTMRLHNPHGCELVFYRRTFAPYVFERRMHALLIDKAVGREWFRVTLADLRQAANKAKGASMKVEREWHRWGRLPTDDFGTPVTHPLCEIEQNQ